MDVLKRIGLYFTLLFLPTVLIAQNPQSATGGEGSLRAGGEFSTFNPDYGCPNASPFQCGGNQLLGPTLFFDLDPRAKWGAEGEARWLDWHGSGGEKMSNYLMGGHYRVWRYQRTDFWLKMLLGGGWFTTPNYPQAGTLKGSYFAMVPGASVEYPFTRRFSLRGDYEYQIWPSFVGPPSYNSAGVLVQHNNGLTPNGFSVGVSYRILGQ